MADFLRASKTFSQVWSLTRASDATYKEVNNTLATVGSDVPRLTLEGLVVEGPNTNVLLRNREFSNNAWNKSGVTWSQDLTGIDGVDNTAWTILDDNAASQELGWQSVGIGTVGSDTQHSGVVYFKKTTGATNYPAIGLDFGSGFATDETRYIIDTNNGTATPATSNNVPSSATVESFGDWWKISITTTQTFANANSVLLYYIWPAFNSDGSGTPDATATGSVGYDFGQFQLNRSRPTSSILTSGSSGTQAQDICFDDNISSWLKSDQFTFEFEVDDIIYDDKDSQQYILSFSDNSFTERVQFNIRGDIPRIEAFVVFGGAFNQLNFTYSNSYKVAFTLDIANQRFALAINGVLQELTGSDIVSFDPTKINLGASFNDTNPIPRSVFKNVIFTPFMKSDAELVSLTS